MQGFLLTYLFHFFFLDEKSGAKKSRSAQCASGCLIAHAQHYPNPLVIHYDRWVGLGVTIPSS